MQDHITFPYSPLLDFGSSPRLGHGYAIGHHGEIIQGVFEDSTGQLRRGLVSLLSDTFKAEATFFPDDSGAVRVEPHWKTKARRAAELTLDYIGRPLGGHLVISSNIPPSWGFGSSTSDVTAATRAVANAFGMELTSKEVARLVVTAETASDPVMFNGRAVLFAQRDAIVIEEFAGAMPALEVLGFNTDPKGVDTLAFPPARYSWWEIEAFRPLVGLIRRAIHLQEPGLIGQAASASAQINQRFLPKPRFDRLERLVDRVGALGQQVAHSGTLVGLLFNPSDVLLEDRISEARELLAEMGFEPTWRFCTESKWSPYFIPNLMDRKGSAGMQLTGAQAE